MIVGPTLVTEAKGTLLAHTVQAGKLVFKKGRLLSNADINHLIAANVEEVFAARLETGEIHEDEAASRIASALIGPGVKANEPFTGRVNLFSEVAGVLSIDAGRINRINLVDESATIATLPCFSTVEAGQMVATIKIIPFATHEHILQLIEIIATSQLQPLMEVSAFFHKNVALIQSILPSVKTSVLDKTVEVTTRRLDRFGAIITGEYRCDHSAIAISATLQEALFERPDILLIAGASAIVDRRDALPEGIVRAGGSIDHYGMPVDPGNMILVGQIEGIPVVGLPGCARSPKLNGFDWVLERLCANLPCGAQEIMSMGVGGLLAEIPSRGLPRATLPNGSVVKDIRAPRIAALVLAAGRSSRMGKANKLLQVVAGRPMLAFALDAAEASNACAVVVVTGHETDAVSPLLQGRDVLTVHNPDYASGLSTSLKAGLRAVPKDIDGVIICLGDMPQVTSEHLNTLIAAFNPLEGRALVVPTYNGIQGNPVLWSSEFIPALQTVVGDQGAKRLFAEFAEQMAEVEIHDNAILLDIDTPEKLALVTGQAV